jgi:hypothetical protein
MRTFVNKVGFWGPRPSNAPTPVASHDLSEREPLLAGHKRPRRCDSVASMFNLSTMSTASDSFRRRLASRCRKYLKSASLALSTLPNLEHQMLTLIDTDRRQT